MGKWSGVVTNAGSALLSGWAAGAVLRIDGAAAGSGTAPAEAMMAQTALLSQKQTAGLTGYEKVDKGVKLRLQLAAPAAGYSLNQIGITARLGDGEPVLLALFQNETGVDIPSRTESPDFIYTFYGVVAVGNTGSLSVNTTPGALVTEEMLEEALANTLLPFGPVNVTIPLAWAGSGPWTQEVAVEGVTADMELLHLSLARIEDNASRKAQEQGLVCVTWCETVDGGLLLTCRDKKPTVALQCVLKGVE